MMRAQVRGADRPIPIRVAVLLFGVLTALAALAALPSVAAAQAEEDGPLMKRLRELTRPDGSVDAPYGTGKPEELEVEAALDRYRAVTTESTATGDDSRLEEVMGDPALARSRAFHQWLRENGRVVESEIQPVSPLAFVELTPERAIVSSRFIHRAAYRDASTGRVLESYPPEVVQRYYLLERLDETGTWKVTDTA
jgi:hypothetical protein